MYSWITPPSRSRRITSPTAPPVCSRLSPRQRRLYVQRPARAGGVVVVHMLALDPLELAATHDEHPVQAVAARRSHPPLGHRVGAW